jgi:hypothetical protein
MRTHACDAKDWALAVKWRGSLAEPNQDAYDRPRRVISELAIPHKIARSAGYAPCALLGATAQHHARTSVDCRREEPHVLRRAGSVWSAYRRCQ